MHNLNWMKIETVYEFGNEDSNDVIIFRLAQKSKYSEIAYSVYVLGKSFLNVKFSYSFYKQMNTMTAKSLQMLVGLFD